jgi:rare lipoprotein A
VGRIFAFSLVLIVLFGGAKDLSAQKEVLARETGHATFYARSLDGRRTASGLTFDNRKFMAAHRSHPFGTVVRVTNLENQRSVEVSIVDRGPFGKNRRKGAIIDVSQAAAQAIGMKKAGWAKVRVEVLKWGTGETVKPH